MFVWPVGVSATNLGVFWPLWDAALLRRYGRAYPSVEYLAAAAASAWVRNRRLGTRRGWQYGPGPLQLPSLPIDLRPPHEEAPPAAPPPPPIALHWPSDDPPVPPQIIVVERWLRERPQMGGLIDVLF